MDDFADLSRRLESMIRLGTIADVQMVPPRVRVQSGALLTQWLPWLSLRAGTTQEWNPPTRGEQGVLLSPSGDPATGVVLLGIPSDAFPTPSTSPDEHVRVYPDGASVRYNHVSGALAVAGIKTAWVQATDHVTVDCPSTTATGDVLIMGNLTVNGDTVLGGTATILKLLTYLAGMAGQGGAGGKTQIQGDIEQVGAFRHTGGDFSSDTVLQDGHHHLDSLGAPTGEPR